MEEARKKRRGIIETFWKAAYPFMLHSNTNTKWSKKHVHMSSVAQSMALGLDFGDGMLCAGFLSTKDGEGFHMYQGDDAEGADAEGGGT